MTENHEYRQRINWPLAITVPSFLLVFVLGVHFLHGYQIKRTADVMLRQAERAGAEGDLDEQIRFQTHYINYVPEDDAAFADWALLIAEKAERASDPKGFVDAYLRLEQAWRRNPENMAVLRRLADYSMRIGRVSDAVDHLSRLSQKFPEELDLEVKLGRCYAATERYRDAMARFERVLSEDPGNLEAYVQLIRLLRGPIDDPDRAEILIHRMVESNSKSAQAYLERARFLQSEEKSAEANKDIAKAIELAPDDRNILLTAARLAMKVDDNEKAREHLRRAQSLYPDDELVLQTMAMLNLAEGKRAEAIEEYKRAAKAKEADPASILPLADLHLQEGDLEAARENIATMRKAGYMPQVVEFYEARALMAERKWRDAMYRLERLRPAVARMTKFADQVDMLLGICYQQLNIPDLQLDVFQGLVSSNPELLPARRGYASALFRIGRFAEALEQYRRIEDTLGTEQFLKNPELRQAMFQLIVREAEAAPESKQDWSELEAFVEKLESIEEVDDVQKTLMRADLLIRQDKTEEARNVIIAARDADPDTLRYWTALANFTIVDENAIAALEILEEAEAAVGDSLQLRLAKAGLATKMRRSKARDVLEELQRGTEEFSENQRVALWQAIGAAYYKLRSRRSAQKMWQRVAEARPEDIGVALTLFELARELGDEAGLTRATDAVERIVGRRSAEWNYCEASRLAWMSHNRDVGDAALVSAKQHLKVAEQTRPNWKVIPRLRAEVAILEGRPDEAIDHFQEAVSLGRLSPNYLSQLVRLLYTRGRFEEAQEVMARLGREQHSPVMRKLGAELGLRTGDLDEALALAADAVENSSDAADFLWYGQLLARAKRNDEAKEAFRRALQLNPRIAEGWLALVVLLVGDDEMQEAQQVVLEAQAQLPEDETALLLAQCYQLMKDDVRAEQYYRNAVSQRPEDLVVLRRIIDFYMRRGHGDKAQKHLATLIEVASADPEKYAAELAWGRRSLARVFASEGDYRRQVQAVKLIQENAIDGKLSSEDLRLKATILATRPERRARLKAIEYFEQLQTERRQKLTAQEQFILAQLYDKTGRWALCREQMLELLTEHPEEPSYLRTFVKMMLDHDSPGHSIEPWLNKLDDLEPSKPSTVGLRAQLLIQSGKREQAIEEVKSLIPRPLPDEQLTTLHRAALLLEELEQYHPAKELLTELAERVPGGNLPLAGFYGRRGSIDDALDQCEIALEDAPATSVLSTAVDVLRKNRDSAKPTHYERVRRWFALAREKSPQSKPLQLHLASFLDLQGKYDELVALYREFLAADDVTDQERAVVYNNLAFILAAGKGSGEEALEMINSAIRVLGPTPELLDTRAVAFMATGDCKSAITDLRHAIADNPTAVKYFHLALAHYRCNDERSAARAFKVAKENHQLSVDEIPPIERDKYRELITSLGVI
jgi:tetratricopeptide (TPR) repeat protein